MAASKPTPEQIAYLAGIVDGEGSFVLHYHARRSKYSSQLQIGNTDLRLLQWIVSNFGGSVYPEHRESPRHKPIWRWISHSESLTDLIESILPYLIVKRSQAELILAYRATVSPVRTTKPTTDSVRETRRELHAKLSVMNQRGVA